MSAIKFRHTVDISTVVPLGIDLSRGHLGMEHTIILAEDLSLDVDSQLVGAIVVIIYADPGEERNPQNHFEQNAWIDHVVSKRKGLGRVLVEGAKAWLLTRREKIRRNNVYVGPCRDMEGFWLKCGFSKLFDDTAEEHTFSTFNKFDSDVLTITAAADNSIVSYTSKEGRSYTTEELMEHTDCGILMGAPLGKEFDREIAIN